MTKLSLRVPQRLRALRRRPLESYDKRALGGVSLLVLLVVLAATLGVNALGLGDRRYTAEFAQAAGLRVGDRVTVAGVEVGSVADQELAGDRVLVDLDIDRGVRLGAETTAAIKLTTLLGARYVELRPAGGDELTDDRIDLAHTEVPYDLQRALENATTTFEEIDAGQLGTSLDALAGQLEGVPAVLPDMLRNIRSLATILGSRRDELGALLTGVRDLTSVVAGQRDDVAAIVTVGRDLLQDINNRRGAIQVLMSATVRLVEQIQAIVGNRPKVDELVHGLQGLLGSLARHDDLLRNTLEILPVSVRNLANASGSGNSVDFNAPGGVLVDSWMCALSGHADLASLPPYFQDCK